MRRRERDALRAQADAAYRRVHPPPQEPAPDIDGAVRRELDRQRAADAEAARLAEESRFAGGPCLHCGRTWSCSLDARTLQEAADWWSHPRGQECGTCRDWRDLAAGRPRPDSELYDGVATVLRDEGLAGLANPNRALRFEPGLAERVGVGPWVDSGQPPGEPWGHLRALGDVAAAEAERRQQAAHRLVEVRRVLAADAAEHPDLTFASGAELNAYHEAVLERHGLLVR